MKTMDHPRLRGEHRWQGSRWRADKGITPAYAGNTKYQVAEVDGFADHPRLRGEHLLYLFAIDIFLGSPPPTRGTQFLNLVVEFLTRITPAYAGNTVVVILSIDHFKDHPRLRGEHIYHHDKF